MRVGRLEIVQIAAGRMANFSYLLYCPVTRQGLAVDPSFEPQELLDAVRRHGVELTWLVNSHGHHDHVAGNEEVLRATGARFAAHSLAVAQADYSLDEGSVLAVGEGALRVLHTPGHSPGHIVLHAPGALLTGDTLFVTRVGRADLPGSDPVALYHSLQRLAGFPEATLVLPGHDYGPRPFSTIGDERRQNPYLQCPDLASFLRLRMG